MHYTLITGPTSGIGYELAHRYAERGQHLILVARNETKLNDLKSKLQAIHSNIDIVLVVVDLSMPEQVEQVIKNLLNDYKIKHLINNAGIGLFQEVKNITREAITSQFDVNVTSPMILSRYALPSINQLKGSIIFIASILSDLPNQKASVYAATKHAILGFANTIRLEHPDVHVLTVHPTTVKTNFFLEPPTNSFQLTPEVVSQKIMKAHRKKKMRLNTPRYGIIRFLYLLFPSLIDSINRKHFTNK